MAQIAQGQAVTPIAPRREGQGITKLEGGSRLIIFLHALTFVIGFGAVFTLIGSLGGLIGQSLTQNSMAMQVEETLRRLGAIVLVLFGLVTLGVVGWLAKTIRLRSDLGRNPAAAALVDVLEFFNGLLYTERRVLEMHRVNRRWGYFSSGLLGVGFAAGWTPCVGPILGTIFFMAGQSATVGHGAALLAIYSLGLGIPFLITAALFSRTTHWLRRLNQYTGIVSIISGIFLLFVAYLLWTNALATLTTRFDVVNQIMAAMNEWVTAGEGWVATVSGTGGDVTGMSVAGAAPLAFFAGLISFLSPCVLPLVPAYIGYLSGAALSSGKS
jgi:cytochrome c-type biogenesis protein